MNKIQILKLILNGNIELIENFDTTQPANLKDEIIIKPKQARTILQEYLNKKISNVDLNKWAKFICMRSEYTVPGGDNDEINDYYEDMYYVIQRLSTPEIDGEINEENVKNYLTELDKYTDQIKNVIHPSRECKRAHR